MKSTKSCWARLIFSTPPLLFFYLLIKKILFLFIWLLWAFVAAYGIQFPNQGSNPGSLHWEHGVLATGPPGKSLLFLFVCLSIEIQLTYNVVLISAVQQCDSIIPIYFFIFFYLMVYLKVLNIVSCAIKQVFVVYLFAFLMLSVSYITRGETFLERR